ncbi:S26 family signal peptidase [Paenibacillus yonginensis]|uniref:Signal peptidase I n=1 Tax=Paenibacillus yonginensis TaxID=1462996 RepID=A0A1B1MXS0_9BACL|nr:signal peptidase I [Paenibacillus yonginensis]ANS73983.1 S26 family signal peptidase [Paenibacillus yonginensis]
MEQSYQEQKQSGQVPDQRKNEAAEWLKAIIIAVVLVLLIRWVLFTPFIVDGPSMQPNFHTGERIIVNKVIYHIRKPKQGDVIVFHVPTEGRDFIKRVIAVPGDTVKVDGDTVTVNGKVLDEPYLKDAIAAAHQENRLYNDDTQDPRRHFPNEQFTEGTVPKGHLFVMGDNRSDSEDSRMIGYIPYKDIVGRADLVFWPFKDIHFIRL